MGRGQPEPVRRASTTDSVFFFQMSLELLRDGVLVNDADTGDPEAVQDGRVDLDRYTVFPQVVIAVLVKSHGIGNDLRMLHYFTFIK